MRINIVNLDKDKWILTKFAKNLKRELLNLGHFAEINKKPKENFDVNHYIIFLFLKDKMGYFPNNTINTVMLTHVNDNFRYNKIKETSRFMDAGIAMSKHHANFIFKKKLGLKRIYFVLPAHDNDLNLKKIHLGIFSNLYNDGRKNENKLEEVLLTKDPKLFKLSIIGKGWESVVKRFKLNGIEVNYQRFFFRRRYLKELSKIDYLIYLGSDEGSMSFLDAIQMGIKTILIPQGFQYDLKKFITFKLENELGNLNVTIDKIFAEKNKYLKNLEILSWKNYALKHLEIWKKLIK